MKANLFSTRTAKAFGAAALAIALFISNPASSLANGGKGDKKVSSLTDQQVSIHYVGTSENNIVFRVEFENPTTEKFWLIIKNDAGDVVYRKQFSDVHFAKTVFFQNDEASDIHPTFVIRNGNNEVVRQFSVNKTLTENTVVTRL